MLGQRVSQANTVASAALRSHRAQHLTDELNRTRFDQHGLGQLGLQATDGLIAPLIFRGAAHGVLVGVDHLNDGGFTAEHERLLEAFAASRPQPQPTPNQPPTKRRRQRSAASEAEPPRWAVTSRSSSRSAMVLACSKVP